ncbi:PREDICTED: uncharacterized protein LOC105952699 [Erythranthe guttata]|uniref:uncharacterized protein LOC105952699 n=1 Tax=Erythranthe guttata TaxID=4155 RepID=UPI00064D8B89|nr:PREDICTED: uncharacterized protein LOC105952699 [Erythranthe guttata]|eukprot:XP_012831738.1 PREDICTED: uncharacterized protein LOC105952699 [Erythranthe guttata]
MDNLLPGESSKILSKTKLRFRSLKLVDFNEDENLAETPYGADYGRLSNGLTYYVSTNSTPKKRAALSLVVNVGSVLEEEEERGVAHIVEHLAFSATKNYTNHDIVKFVESIGAEFGPCQNASTTEDETIYELFVPIDKPELISQSISVLAEFSSEIRVSVDDLETERGAVLEEYRGRRDADGRMNDAHWAVMLEGSKYAERLPIGLENVIRTVSPEIVKRFYNKWYQMQNMALIIVGDFPDTQSVVELIKTHFEDKTPKLDPTPIPRFTVPSHEEPRFSVFVESEAAGSVVGITFKIPTNWMKTVKDYRNFMAEDMFFNAMNQRLFKLSHKKDPPYFSCSAASNGLVRATKAYTMTSSCKHNGIIESLESMLIEHFFGKLPVVDPEYEAKLFKTILPYVSASEVSQFSEYFRTSFNCVIKTIEPQATATLDDLRSVVLRVNALEEEGSIFPWEDESTVEEIVRVEPTPGHVVQQLEYPIIDATELILSNGMRVCCKSTDFFDDQVLFTGFSYGGLSELKESDYFSCLMGSDIAEQTGLFGHRAEVLTDMLAGKRVNAGTSLGIYKRSFSGYCSPSDLEIALQTMKMDDLKEVDPVKGCEYFNNSFKDPSTFTVVIIGKIEPTIASPLILQYLMEDKHLIQFMSKLLETKILQVLRFKHGQIYSTGVSMFFGGNKPSRVGDVRGDLNVYFSCDPVISSTLLANSHWMIYIINAKVDLVLDEILRLQVEGPSDDDVSAILEIEQRTYEIELQDNYYWLEMIMSSYQSRNYSGDIDASFKVSICFFHDHN